MNREELTQQLQAAEAEINNRLARLLETLVPGFTISATVHKNRIEFGLKDPEEKRLFMFGGEISAHQTGGSTWSKFSGLGIELNSGTMGAWTPTTQPQTLIKHTLISEMMKDWVKWEAVLLKEIYNSQQLHDWANSRWGFIKKNEERAES